MTGRQTASGTRSKHGGKTTKTTTLLLVLPGHYAYVTDTGSSEKEAEGKRREGEKRGEGGGERTDKMGGIKLW